MTEETFFLRHDGERILAFLHRPDGSRKGGVVLCAPLAEEKLWSHRVFVSFARELAKLGYAVLRFDHRGEGDSDRTFEASDLTTRVEDTTAAIEELKRRATGLQQVTLVGLRLGASVAALAAAERDDVERLVLWDPVVSGADYMQSVLRTNLMAQMAQRKVAESRESLVERLQRGETINIEGYELSDRLFHEVSAFQLGSTIADSRASIQVVAISPRVAPARAELSALAAERPNVTTVSVVEELFWREIKAFYQRADVVFKATIDWLEAVR